MEDMIVRLVSLTLANIKNVNHGTISMPCKNNHNSSLGGAEVLGIYGQNGSGKTAVVDAMYFLQQLMVGNELSPEILDYIDADADTAEINAEFKLFATEVVYEVGYTIKFKRENDTVSIEREVLDCATNRKDSRTKKYPFIEYQQNSDFVFKPQNRYSEVAKDKDTKTDLLVAKKIAEKSKLSYIFASSSREIFCRNYDNEFEKFSKIVASLFGFALKDLFVIRSSHSAVISANVMLPMAFRIGNNSMGAKGDLPILLVEPVVLKTTDQKLLNLIIKQINTVLYTIIPGMKIEVKDYGPQTLDSGEEGHKLELLSHREGKTAIPIRMESEGIIKIVSILNALIQAYSDSSVCLVIDELDAGIFEYMLGELLYIFAKNAKGQLIFTSHNLRALEMLDKESIMFSTVNPNNRYIHLKNVKETNNLRSMYIRSITLGGQDEKIYEDTDSIKIARAFRKAGRSLRNEQ